MWIMDDCTLYHEMALYVMQRKSQWKKIKNYKIKGVLHPRALFLKILYIFSKTKATSD